MHKQFYRFSGESIRLEFAASDNRLSRDLGFGVYRADLELKF